MDIATATVADATLVQPSYDAGADQRLQCLKLAAGSNVAGCPADEVVAAAQKYFDFVSGAAKPEVLS